MLGDLKRKTVRTRASAKEANENYIFVENCFMRI